MVSPCQAFVGEKRGKTSLNPAMLGTFNPYCEIVITLLFESLGGILDRDRGILLTGAHRRNCAVLCAVLCDVTLRC
jgi:hypothetical protein